jgi:hypothetical protein
MMRDPSFIDILEQFWWLVNVSEKSLFFLASCGLPWHRFQRIDYGVFRAICVLSAILVIAPCKPIRPGLPSWRIRRVQHRGGPDACFNWVETIFA